VSDADGDQDLPRLPGRTEVNKHKQTIDDLLTLFTIINEWQLSVAISRYTADDLSRIPFVNADSNALTSAKKIEVLEQRMNSLEQLLLASMPLAPVQKDNTAAAHYWCKSVAGWR